MTRQFDGLAPLDYLRGIRDGNIVPTIENLRAALRNVLVPSRRPIADITQSAEHFAVAQEHMAANSKEDFEHWHHVALAGLLREMAVALSRPNREAPHE